VSSLGVNDETRERGECGRLNEHERRLARRRDRILPKTTHSLIVKPSLKFPGSSVAV